MEVRGREAKAVLGLEFRTMSRTEKLFWRLDQLEGEFRKVATTELQAFLRGSFSQILSRVYSDTFRGKKWRSEECGDFEWMEKEIEALRVKLEQPVSESPVGQLRTLLQQLDAEKKNGTGMEFRIVQELLRRWGRGDVNKDGKRVGIASPR